MSAEAEQLGDCYPSAFRLARSIEGSVLVHAEVWHEQTGWHGHAWTEVEEEHQVPRGDRPGEFVAMRLRLALDRANGLDVSLPAGAYRNFGRARNVVEYSPEEAARLALDSGHFGPW